MFNLFIHYLGKLVVHLHYKDKLDIYALTSTHNRDKIKHRVSQKTRWSVWRRDHFTCVYCLSMEGRPTIDHKVPICKGGSSKKYNLVTACAPCNCKKGDMTEEEFRRTKWLKKKRRRNLQRLSTTTPVTESTGSVKTSLSTGALN